MKQLFSKIFLICFLGMAFFCSSPHLWLLAQEDLAEQCQLESIEQAEQTLSREQLRQLLEDCRDFYQQRTEELEGEIETTSQQKKSLANQISILSKKISSLGYQIQQGNVMIKDLSSQIDDTAGSIEKTETKIKQVQDKLIILLQLRYREDQRTVVEILLSEGTLVDFFDDLVALEMLNLKTQEFLGNIKDLKASLEGQRAVMDKEKEELQNLVIIQTLQKNESANNKKEQEYFLKLTEEQYQTYLAEKKEAEATASKIGNMLFELLEVPEGGIRFEDAVEIAKNIAKQTGVRPAFSLAVLWQETRIGKLQGGCYLKNTKTGEGVYIKTGNTAPRTMSPSRDVGPFLSLITELNQAGKLKTDAFSTPVSCCMIRNGSYFGWGGAMGPAQFIPSTWALFKERIESITGDKPASPWSVRDAFLANALYLKDLGAGSQTYEKEIYAALRYFGCTSSWCRANYGAPVMKAAACLQTYIDSNSMSSSCQDLIF